MISVQTENFRKILKYYFSIDYDSSNSIKVINICNSKNMHNSRNKDSEFQSLDNQNDRIAQIYEKLQTGNPTAAKQLNKVKNTKTLLGNTPQKIKSQKQHRKNEPLKLQQEEDNIIGHRKKSQTFKSYLKQKVTQLRHQRANQNIRNEHYDRQLPQYQSIDKMSSNKKQGTNIKQFQQPKPFNRKKLGNSKSHNDSYPKAPTTVNESQQNPSYRSQNKNINQQNSVALVPSPATHQNVPINKSSNTRENFRQKLQKNTIRDMKQSQVSQLTNKNVNNQVQSKQSFRIKNQPPNRKIKQELIRLNEEEKQIQMELFNYHNSTKQQVQQIRHKYNLRSKGQISRQIQVVSKSMKNFAQFDSPSSPQIRLQNPVFNDEKQKCNNIYNQLAKINAFLQKTKSNINESQNKIQASPLLPYLVENDDIFQQRQSEQEAESVQQLPKQVNNNDPTVMGKTYQKVMNQIKKKKWGNNKRFQYDLVKPSVMGQSKMSKFAQIRNNKYDQEIIVEQESPNQKDNKVTVNPKLKDLLFD